MVKIKRSILVAGLIVFAMIIVLNSSLQAHAASGKNLLISNVDVKVSSKTLRNLSDGDTVSEEARPDHTVEFRVEVHNNFTRSTDIKIRDITVKTTIEGIDGGEDMEIESDRFDLSANTERKSFFKFNIPLQVREDLYNVVITAEGQDEDGVTVQISNKDLGLDIKDKIGTIFSRPNEPESKFSKTYMINVPKDAEAGNYLITLKALFNDDRKSTENTANLIVNNCAKAEAPKAPKPSEEGTGVEVIMPKNNSSAAADSTIPEGAIVTKESFLSGNVFVAAIVIAEIIAVIAGIFLIAYIFRKKSPVK